MRTKKTIKNTIYSMANYFMSTLLRFAVRYIFILKLGIELLGLNGLFSSIVAVFALAELGFGISIGAMLYKPMVDNDAEKIKSYIAITKKIFSLVGIIIIVGGLALTPFLEFFIKDNTLPINEVRVYFLLYVAASAVSYFNIHKVVIVDADQKAYIYRRYSMIFNIINSTLQITAILILKSFYIFLTLTVITTIIQNLMLSRTINKMYPYIKEKNIQALSKEEKTELLKKVLGLASLKIGAVVISAADNLFISKMIGIDMVGYYSNYVLVIGSVSQLTFQFLNGSMASIGNLWATESKEKVYSTFKNMQFIQFWLSAVSSTAMFVLLEPFIKLWLGDDFLLGQVFVGVIVLNFYLTNMRTTTTIFKSAKGLHWHDRFNPVIEAVLKVVASLLLIKTLGVTGLILGSIIAAVGITVWNEPRVLFKHGLNMSMKKYWIDYFVKFIIMALITFITYFTCSFLGGHAIMFVIKFLICAVVPNLLLFLLYFRTLEFRAVIGIFKNLLNRRKNTSESDSI